MGGGAALERRGERRDPALGRAAWTAVASPLPHPLKGVWGSASEDVFAVGARGAIVHWDGVAWSAMSSGTSQNLWDVWGSSSGDVYAVGDAGTVLRYDGAGWDPVSLPFECPAGLLGVWTGPGADVLVVGTTA